MLLLGHLYIHKSDAKFTLHDYSPIFIRLTGFDKSQKNAQNRRQIGAPFTASDNRVTIGVNYQRRDLRSSPMHRRNPGNI